MGLFSRKQLLPKTSRDPIAEFWTWWQGEGRRLDPHQASPALDQLSHRLVAIHPELTWHFGAGATSEHRLTVSAGGVAAVRPAAERWLHAAPAPDETWEYRSSKEADPSVMTSSLSIAGHQVDLSHTVFRVDSDRELLRVNVGVFHPVFPDLDDGVRAQISFLVVCCAIR